MITIDYLTEAFGEGFPLWVKSWLKSSHGRNVLNKYDWNKSTFTRMPIPETPQKANFKGPQTQMQMYLISNAITHRWGSDVKGYADSDSIGNVFVPGVNDIYIQTDAGNARISKVPYKYWKEYIEDYGVLDAFEYGTTDKKQGRKDWADYSYKYGNEINPNAPLYKNGARIFRDSDKADYTRRSHYGQQGDSMFISDADYTYNNNKPRRDKSGYLVNPDKYKNMLRQLKLSGGRYKEQLETELDRLGNIRKQISTLSSDLENIPHTSAGVAEYKRKSRQFRGIIGDFESAMDYVDDIFNYLEYSQQEGLETLYADEIDRYLGYLKDRINGIELDLATGDE